MQEFEFIDNRRAFRFAGILLLAVGLLAAYLIFFAGTGRTSDPGKADIRLPKIGALPPEGASKTSLQLTGHRETHP
jgi:hypothetical protein